jgi:probable phosphoglycerate mutase
VRVDLVRHGATDVPAGTSVGASDVALSADGAVATERAAIGLRARGYARVVSSDLVRCSALAHAVSGAATLDARLREQSLGVWEGASWAALRAAHPDEVSAFWSDYAVVAAPGGEALRDVQARALAALGEAIEGLRPDDALLVVTHAGVVRALACAWMATPLAQALRWSPAHLGRASFSLDPAGAVLEGFNLPP